LVHCHTPNEKVVKESCQALDDKVHKVILILHGNSHFVVLEVDLTKRIVIIYDGLKYHFKLWLEHINNVMKRTELISTNQSLRIVKKDKDVFLSINKTGELETGHWKVRMKDSFIKQNNTDDCGPICCLHLMQLFERLPPQSKMSGEMSTKQL
jgi:hypothetical protein